MAKNVTDPAPIPVSVSLPGSEKISTPVWHYVFLGAVVLFGIWLRWFNLEEKPFHHDEAIFAMYGYYFFKDPVNAFYKYIPMLNGPILFHVLEQLFRTFAPLNWVARFPAAFLGTLFLAVPFFFQRFFTRSQFYLFLCLVAFSPVYVYYSRFLRHEYLVIFIYLGLMYFMFSPQAQKSHKRYFWIPFLLWLHWTVKENFYVFVAMLLGFIVYQVFFLYLAKRTKEISFHLTTSALQNILFGLLAGLFVFAYFYSAGFKFWDGFYDGLYRQGISYWWNQHSIERITGPFSIHFLMLTWYEFAFLVVFLTIQTKMLFHYLHRNQFYLLLSVLGFIALLSNFIAPSLLAMDLFKTGIKLKIALDVFIFFAYIILAVLVPTLHLIKKEKNLAWMGYLFWANLFTYSFLGEKVPWLVMYPMFFGGLYMMTFLAKNQKLFSEKLILSLLGLTILYGVTTSVRTGLVTAADNREFIIQVHPFKVYTDYVTELRHKLESKYPKNTLKILMMDDPVWITLWYWKDFEAQYQYDPKLDPKTFDVIVCNKPALGIQDTHDLKEILYSGWWVPDYTQMTFFNFTHYMFYHRPWSVMGDLKMTIWIKKGLI
ncbi:MAG: TIGR03663 family protein [Bacteriovoracaceae bacterium]|nr:TIGR03663 family protein [Bacteriovoracaceae bacterium]